MGFDPGISNVMARDAAEPFEAIDAIRIRAGDLVPAGAGLLPLSSREAFLANVLARPTVWLENELRVRDPLSEPENFPFPAPVGTQRTYLIAHEEVETLPRFLGKPIGRVDYKHALHPDVVRALVSLDRLGLLSDFRMIRVGNQMVSFRRALLAAFPEPSARVLPLQGATALTVEIEDYPLGRGAIRAAGQGEVPPEPAILLPAVGQLADDRQVVVDLDGPEAEGVRHAVRALHVLRPHGRIEAVDDVVGRVDRLLLIRELLDTHHGSEHFLPRDPHGGIGVHEGRRFVEPTLVERLALRTLAAEA